MATLGIPPATVPAMEAVVVAASVLAEVVEAEEGQVAGADPPAATQELRVRRQLIAPHCR